MAKGVAAAMGSGVIVCGKRHDFTAIRTYVVKITSNVVAVSHGMVAAAAAAIMVWMNSHKQ